MPESLRDWAETQRDNYERQKQATGDRNARDFYREQASRFREVVALIDAVAVMAPHIGTVIEGRKRRPTERVEAS
jgi:hypothetical protein